MKLYPNNQLYVTNRKEWRKWLIENHDKYSEIWLVYYKKISGKKRIHYNDAVEEALCFGWIDSIIKRIDDTRYMQKFTPRNDNSKWSELNKKRAMQLIDQGKMTKTGLSKIEYAKKYGKWDQIIKTPSFGKISPEFSNALDKNKKAKQYFESLAPSYQKQYIGWIASSKKSETRQKRIKEAIRYLENKQKLGLK